MAPLIDYMIYALFTFGVGLFLYGFIAVKVTRKYKNWADTKATIIRYDLVEVEQPEVYVNTPYSVPVIEYEYSFDGIDYIGYRIHPNSAPRNLASWLQENTQTIACGQDIHVRVNQCRPEESFISTRLSRLQRSNIYSAWAGSAICVAISLFVMLY